MNSADPQPAICARSVTKHFPGGIQALRGVSFDVAERSIFTILGPNGAGKTTLLRILTTLTRPTSGQVTIFGKSLQKDTLWVRTQLGVVSQENHFNKYLTVQQNMELHAQMQGLDKPVYEVRIRELLEMMGLSARKDAQIDDLSGGMQRRLVLARALIHKPRLLFLDEPTTGLDPEARQQLWQYILALRDETTLILTTHYMEEADQLSDTILMIHQGTSVMAGTPRELKARFTSHNQYMLELTSPTAQEVQQALASLNLPQLTVETPYLLRLQLHSPEEIPQVLTRLPHPEALQRFGLAEANLEEVFLAVAAGNRSGKEATS